MDYQEAEPGATVAGYHKLGNVPLMGVRAEVYDANMTGVSRCEPPWLWLRNDTTPVMFSSSSTDDDESTFKFSSLWFSVVIAGPVPLKSLIKSNRSQSCLKKLALAGLSRSRLVLETHLSSYVHNGFLRPLFFRDTGFLDSLVHVLLLRLPAPLFSAKIAGITRHPTT